MHIKLLFLAFLIFGFNHSAYEHLQQNENKTKKDHFKTEMLEIVNQIRSEGCQCGKRYMPAVPPVQWNTKLEKAATSHVKDMNTNKFLGHKGSDRSKISERIDAAGYDWMAVGENVSWGPRSVEEAVLGWKDSAGHCMTLMSSSYKEIGAANDGKFWVQNFGQKME